MAKDRPTVYMMLGLPGSGKTTFSKQLAERLGLPRFSLDEEYFAEVGNTQQEHRDFEVEAKIGEQIQNRVRQLLNQNHSVVLDLCPWKAIERKTYRKFVEDAGGQSRVFYFDVSKEELLKRIRQRNSTLDAANQFMTPQMLEDFIANKFEAPTPDELVEIVHE